MKTKLHPGDYNRKPRGDEREYTTYICPMDGSYVIPSLDEAHKGYCPKCGGLVALCGVPMTYAGDVRAEYKHLDAKTSASYGQAGEEMGTRFIVSGGEVIEFGSRQWFDGLPEIEF